MAVHSTTCTFTNAGRAGYNAPLTNAGRGGYNGPQNEEEDDERCSMPMNFGRGGYNAPISTRSPDDDDEEEDGRGGYN